MTSFFLDNGGAHWREDDNAGNTLLATQRCLSPHPHIVYIGHVLKQILPMC